jgi:hypothetical protein
MKPPSECPACALRRSASVSAQMVGILLNSRSLSRQLVVRDAKRRASIPTSLSAETRLFQIRDTRGRLLDKSRDRVARLQLP